MLYHEIFLDFGMRKAPNFLIFTLYNQKERTRTMNCEEYIPSGYSSWTEYYRSEDSKVSVMGALRVVVNIVSGAFLTMALGFTAALLG